MVSWCCQGHYQLAKVGLPCKIAAIKAVRCQQQHAAAVAQDEVEER
jgi:hypothetical protein